MIGILVNIYLARTMGAEYYGEVSYAIAFVAFFDAVNLLGLNQIVVRELSQSQNNKKFILDVTISLRLISAFLSFFLSVFFAFALGKNLLAIVIVSCGLIFSLGNVCDLFFQSEIKSKYTVIAKIIAYVFSAFFKVFIIWYGGSVSFYLIAVPLEMMTISFILIYLLYRKYKLVFTINFPKFKNDSYYLEILRESLPLMMSNLAVVTFMRSGVMAVEYFLGSRAVGLYSVGANLAEMIFFVPGIIVTSFSPILANLSKNNKERYFLLYQRLMFVFWWGSFISILFYGSLLYYLIPFLYGADFSLSKYIFIVHLLSFLPVCMGCCQTIWVINEKKPNIILIQTIVGALLALILNIYFVQSMGVIGAPIAILIAQIVQSFIVNYFFCKDLFVFTFRSLLWR
ncbi:Polysaccharide biosynthesis protein [Vibrio ruber DSM 16370]|uniref:Polysaccharide biosynthesis protein n=2 Tax=Vibrio ruber TaxID=184755 RepID=A0A1R4LLF3_VIBR1|nr:Polysaccharide biosynthesis protein [Vibrio ruber DSM 16370]